MVGSKSVIFGLFPNLSYHSTTLMWLRIYMLHYYPKNNLNVESLMHVITKTFHMPTVDQKNVIINPEFFISLFEKYYNKT